jgi:hypothetical protein
MVRFILVSFVIALAISHSAFAAEGTSAMKIDESAAIDERPVSIRLVPQIGASTLGYTGKAEAPMGTDLSGGILAEFGRTKSRLIETGLLLIRTNSDAKIGPNGETEPVKMAQLAIPMVGKFRVLDLKSQAWYVNAGALTAFETASNQDETSRANLYGLLGIGARLPMTRKLDLRIDADYNYGVLPAFVGRSGTHQGFLFLTGVSFGI